MPLVIRMPKLSDTMQNGKISSWLKKIGDTVKPGTVIAEIETDKAIMELESEEDGVILYLGAKEKESLAINSILAIIGSPEEDISHLLSNNKNIFENDATLSSPTHSHTMPLQTPNLSTSEQNQKKILASPLAKAIAKKENINLSSIIGSGENNRIIKRDLTNYLNTSTTKTSDYHYDIRPYKEIPLNSIRSIVSKKLVASKQNIPHFYLNMSINMTSLVEIRSDINDFYKTKISFNDIIIKAVAITLKKHPTLNATWHETFIRQYQDINIGIAVATDDALVVPVLQQVDSKSLSQISIETKKLQEKSISKKLNPTDIQGSTFTISNLGMYGIESFSAIINPPEACILAIGAIEKKPIFKENEITVGSIMNITLSCDHRIIDGAIGASFLRDLKYLLEHPHLLLLQ